MKIICNSEEEKIKFKKFSKFFHNYMYMNLDEDLEIDDDISEILNFIAHIYLNSEEIIEVRDKWAEHIEKQTKDIDKEYGSLPLSCMIIISVGLLVCFFLFVI